MKKFFISASNHATVRQLRVFIISILFGMSFGTAFAQLEINSSGNVGIDASNAQSKFSIGDVGGADSKVYIYSSNINSDQKGLVMKQEVSTGSWTYGVIGKVLTGSSNAKIVGTYGSAYKSTPYSSGRSFGLYSIAGNATSGYNYAVYGRLLGSNNGAAIYGAIPSADDTYINGIYAGYFRGKVYIEDQVGIKTTSPSYDLDVNGTIRCVSLTQTSDLAVKKEVKNLEKGSLTNIKKLNGVKYKLKSPEELGLLSQTTMATDTGTVELPTNELSPELYNKEFTGFIAQDVQEVYPDLVSEDSDGQLSINYIGLIPILVEAMKEQQAEIEALKKQIAK